MRNGAVSSVSRPMFLVLAVIVVAVVGCGEEPPEPETPPAAAVQPVETAAPSRPAVAPTAAVAPAAANTPVPARAAEPVATVATDATPITIAGRVQPRLRVPGVDLHHSQVVTAPGRMRDNMAPWRDGGGNRLFSTHVFGTPFMLNEKGEAVPWIATGITSNEDMTVWTMKLREDAVFQDGTPITAADFKAYWEHGGRSGPWGGAWLTLRAVRGWLELNSDDVTEAEGLRVLDDHTLEIEIEDIDRYPGDRWLAPMAAWPLYMAAWHVGISKLDQVLADENWGNAPIGAGPFSLTYDPESGLTELTRVDLVGKHWNGPHDTPIIEKLVLPNIPDVQTQVLMFENGEIDLMRTDLETYEAALDSGHPFNPHLHLSSHGVLSVIELRNSWVPLEELRVRKALVHGQDMESIVGAIWGPTGTHAKGIIASHIPCHDPDADYQSYDPDLARQHLAESTYGTGAKLPMLGVDLSRPDTVAMGVAVKEFWKDNLGVELDVLKRESGMPRRESSQLLHLGWGLWMPDPLQIVGYLKARFDRSSGSYRIPGGYPVLDALFEYARSLPLDHPERCLALQAVEELFLDKAFFIPIREMDPVAWLVQPWLRGFESTFNQDFNTLTTAYVVRH